MASAKVQKVMTQPINLIFRFLQNVSYNPTETDDEELVRARIRLGLGLVIKPSLLSPVASMVSSFRDLPNLTLTLILTLTLT